MDHSKHMDMGGGNSAPGHGNVDACNLHMIFTWDWKDSCIVFKSWHVRSVIDFIFSLIGIAVLTIGYEYIKSYAARVRRRRINTVVPQNLDNSLSLKFRSEWASSVLYGIQVGYSFLIMLVFMSYNGWYMLAVVVGAILGHHIFSVDDAPIGNSLACH